MTTKKKTNAPKKFPETIYLTVDGDSENSFFVNYENTIGLDNGERVAEYQLVDWGHIVTTTEIHFEKRRK